MSITTRNIKYFAEFEQVDNIYQECFGEDSVPSAVQQDWWKKFPNGIIGLLLNETIIGGMSYWPLNKKVFDDLSNGKIKEKEITSQSIDIVRSKGIYISEIAILPTFRKKNYAVRLLHQFIEERNGLKVSNKLLPVLALAYSKEGKNILQKMGFILLKSSHEMPDKQDLYLLND